MKPLARGLARIILGWAPEEHIQDTAWLNGVRGLAAFLVMMNHYSMAWLSAFAEAPFGAAVVDDTALSDVWYFHKGDRLWAPWRLPIIRVFMANGGGQVAIFFVISGFVLTWGPLGLVQAGGKYEKLYQTLGSSTFRRWSRLYLPCVIVSFINVSYDIFKQYEGIVPALQTVWEYLVHAEIWANPFNTVAETVLSKIYANNLVLWTIPHEFSGSIFVYVLLLTLGRVQDFPRRITMIALIALYALFSLRWGLWLFGSGMALADYARRFELLKKQSYTPGTSARVMWSLCLLLGLLLLSFMSETEYFTRPGYEWSVYLPLPHGWRDRVGEERFWWGCGAILFIASSCHLKLVRRFFELAALQHLGKLSFMLYLIHLLIGNVVGGQIKDAIYPALCTKERDEVFGFDVCHINPFLNVTILVGLWLVTVPIVLVVAHVLETFVDRPVTTFGKWMDDKLVHGFPRRAEALKDMEPEQEQLLGPVGAEELEMGGISQQR